MFVMLFIYVTPFNYSFVYLFMEELTEIGKFIFAEGHLAPLYPLPTQRERGDGGWGGVGTSGLLVIALCGVSLDSPEDVIFIQADGSEDRRRQTGRETSEWKLRGGKSMGLVLYFSSRSYNLALS